MDDLAAMMAAFSTVGGVPQSEALGSEEDDDDPYSYLASFGRSVSAEVRDTSEGTASSCSGGGDSATDEGSGTPSVSDSESASEPEPAPEGVNCENPSHVGAQAETYNSLDSTAAKVHSDSGQTTECEDEPMHAEQSSDNDRVQPEHSQSSRAEAETDGDTDPDPADVEPELEPELEAEQPDALSGASGADSALRALLADLQRGPPTTTTPASERESRLGPQEDTAAEPDPGPELATGVPLLGTADSEQDAEDDSAPDDDQEDDYCDDSGEKSNGQMEPELEPELEEPEPELEEPEPELEEPEPELEPELEAREPELEPELEAREPELQPELETGPEHTELARKSDDQAETEVDVDVPEPELQPVLQAPEPEPEPEPEELPETANSGAPGADSALRALLADLQRGPPTIASPSVVSESGRDLQGNAAVKSSVEPGHGTSTETADGEQGMQPVGVVCGPASLQDPQPDVEPDQPDQPGSTIARKEVDSVRATMRETFTMVGQEGVPPEVAAVDEHGGDDAMHEVEVTDINKRIWLRAVPMFAELVADDDFISALANVLEKRSIKRKTLIISKGDAATEMYFVVRGEASVLDDPEDAKEKAVATISPSNKNESACLFGEEGVLTGSRRNAYVRAEKTMQLYVLRRSNLEKVLKAYPAVDKLLRAQMEKRCKVETATATIASPELQIGGCQPALADEASESLERADDGDEIEPESIAGAAFPSSSAEAVESKLDVLTDQLDGLGDTAQKLREAQARRKQRSQSQNESDHAPADAQRTVAAEHATQAVAEAVPDASARRILLANPLSAKEREERRVAKSLFASRVRAAQSGSEAAENKNQSPQPRLKRVRPLPPDVLDRLHTATIERQREMREHEAQALRKTQSTHSLSDETLQRLTRPRQRPDVPDALRSSSDAQRTAAAESSKRLKAVSKLSHEVEERLHNRSISAARRREEAAKTGAPAKSPPRLRAMSPLSAEAEQRLYTNSKSRLRRLDQSSEDRQRDARILAYARPMSLVEDSKDSNGNGIDDSIDEEGSSVSSGPSEFIWGPAAETDIADFLLQMQGTSVITSTQQKDLLHALRQAEVETLGDLDFLAHSRSALLKQLMVVVDGEEDAQPLAGAEQLWEALNGARTLQVSDDEGGVDDASDVLRGQKRVPSAPVRLAQLARPKPRTENRPPLAAAPITARGLHVTVQSPWADSRVADKRRSANRTPRAVSPPAVPRVAEVHTSASASKRRHGHAHTHTPKMMPWAVAAAATLSAPSAGLREGSPGSVQSGITKSSSFSTRRSSFARNYAAPTRAHGLKTVDSGMAEHQFAEKGWAHGLRSGGTGRGAISGFKSAHPRPATRHPPTGSTRRRRAMSAPRERAPWDSSVSNPVRDVDFSSTALARSGVDLGPRGGWQWTPAMTVEEMNRRLQALEFEVEESGLEQYRLGKVLHPAPVSNRVDLGPTLIQRLGNDGLLIGSRRRMSAAPLVVGGADPVAAEVTTTAGLGDGTVELGASLIWIEALLSWTAQFEQQALELRRHPSQHDPETNVGEMLGLSVSEVVAARLTLQGWFSELQGDALMGAARRGRSAGREAEAQRYAQRIADLETEVIESPVHRRSGSTASPDSGGRAEASHGQDPAASSRPVAERFRHVL